MTAIATTPPSPRRRNPPPAPVVSRALVRPAGLIAPAPGMQHDSHMSWWAIMRYRAFYCAPSDDAPQLPATPTVRDIQNATARHYRVTVLDMLSVRRTLNVMRPRQVAMYLAKSLTPRSLPDIGRRFGDRDHTTVLHSVRKIERLLATDHALAADIAAIRSMLGVGAWR